MKRSILFKVLCALIAIMIFASMASSASRRKRIPPKPQPVRDTITFEGDLILLVGDETMRVKGNKTISMPSEIRIETQDDNPSVIAQILVDEGYTRQNASVSVRVSRKTNSFKVSGRRVEGVYAIRRVKGERRLESLRGRTIPARTGDYYIKLSNKREDRSEDASVLRYLKIRVRD